MSMTVCNNCLSKGEWEVDNFCSPDCEAEYVGDKLTQATARILELEACNKRQSETIEGLDCGVAILRSKTKARIAELEAQIKEDHVAYYGLEERYAKANAEIAELKSQIERASTACEDCGLTPRKELEAEVAHQRHLLSAVQYIHRDECDENYAEEMLKQCVEMGLVDCLPDDDPRKDPDYLTRRSNSNA